MNAADSRLWMRGRPKLLAMVVRFNTLAPSSIHPGRAPAWLQEEAIRKVSSTSRGRRRLSEALRRWVKLNTPGFYDFQPLHRRFALLEVSTLERLAAFTGAVLLSPRLARIVCRDQRNEVRKELGGELFDFATKRARFLLHDALDSPLPTETTLDVVHGLGWTQLERCLAGESPNLIRRFQLKLPPEVDLEKADVSSGVPKDQAATLVRKVLISEVKPELAPCFA